ncbi:MAG TPA: sortase [Candidatus Acidoferrum sp.]|nr:sortase [Candidatus Acidoferrum sp.]
MASVRATKITLRALRPGAAGAAAMLLGLVGLVVEPPALALAAGLGCVTPGNDGPVAALTGVVNSYYPATASAPAGATSISVGARIPGGSPAIAAGDLLLVIQMQDADINGVNSIAYGDGATGRGSNALHSTGLYEYVEATSAVVAGAVGISGIGGGGGLANAYDFSAAVTASHGFRTFQVIRVPQYSSATVVGGLTATAWDGGVHAGGVLAIDVAGALNLNGQTISVNQLGFKGGLGVAQAGPLNGDTGTDYARPSLNGAHGYKGEGIAGTPRFLYDSTAAAAVNGAADGYPIGDAARGAPGNAGGGGTDADPVINDQNSGGGGGANGGQGGMGGNSWNSNLAVGGLGGAAFPAAPARVVLGGGGGAGSRNNSSAFASSGGTGGGIVMIRTGTLTGAGTINANGGVGVTPDNDGGGGGGAGGSIVVSASAGTVNGLTATANGGNGTDAWPADAGGLPDRHGPGGGGSGGVIITSNALPPAQASVQGGAHGITTTLDDAYGSTSGNPGVVLTTTLAAIPGSSSGAECVSVVAVSKTTSTANVTNTVTGTTATYSITLGNSAGTAPATNVSVSDALPAGFTYASTGGIALNGGATQTAAVNPVVGDTSPIFGSFSIPAAGSVVITFTVNIAPSVATGTYNNAATATYLDPTRTTIAGTATVTYPGGGPERVSVGVPDMTLAKTHTDPFVRGSTTATYTLTAHNSGGGPTTGTVTVTDVLPAGLTPTAVAGSGWTCPVPSGQTVSCTRSDSIGAGASYPVIRITVTVLSSAPGAITNVATVSGGGETNAANDTASDPTNIISLAGLPNTSGVQLLGDGSAMSAPTTPSIGWLAALFVLALAAGLTLAIVSWRRTHVRFRQRRRRPGLGATPGLISVVLCALAIGQFVPVPSAAAVATAAPVVSADEVGARAGLVGPANVAGVKPVIPAVPTFHAASGSITPSRLRIPSIGVDAAVAAVGLMPDGSMGAPTSLWTSAWLSSSARPGQAGSAVIAGHRGIGTQALFSHLENLRPGDQIQVSDASGGELIYQVTRVASMDLSDATQLQVFGPTTEQRLVLITCYGHYSRSTRTYDHRLVVFSRLLPPQ